MSPRSRALVALTLVALTAAPAAAQPGRPRDGDGARYGWLGSLDEGKTRARTTGQPLMVVLRCVP
jgi:hypothetical protein